MDSPHGNPSFLSLAHLTLIDADPITLIDAAAAGRFDAIGLRIVPPMPTDRIVPVIGDETLIRDIENRLDATGTSVLDIEAVWLTPQTIVERLEPALELGARLRAKHLLVVGNDPEAGRLRDNFAKLCDLAASFGIGIALEMMSYVTLNTLPKAFSLLDEVRRPNARLLIDALHLVRSDGKPGDLVGLAPELFPYVHLCDAAVARPPDLERLRFEGRSGRFYPGEGELPLLDLLNALPADIAVAVEAPCAGYAALSPLERGRICGAATRALLSAVHAARATGQ